MTPKIALRDVVFDILAGFVALCAFIAFAFVYSAK
jgi:hypothetical protein